jgi:uncharacterized protein (TIGR03086 family)
MSCSPDEVEVSDVAGTSRMKEDTMTGFDPRPLLGAALDQAGELIAAATPDQAHLPTPCEDYDVNQLISHMQAVVRRIGVVLSGQPFWSVPREMETTDWVADWAAGRAATDAVLADDACLTREVSVPWGTVSGASAAASYIGELSVHSWDLATALGTPGALNDALATAALPAYMAKVPAEPRGPEIPFGPVVEVGPDATPYERLVAWTGRDPRWAA